MTQEIAAWYERFARTEAHGNSAIYETLALGVARDDVVLSLIEQLPHRRRQPNLILACSRLLGAPIDSYESWRDWVVGHWPAVFAEASVRLTQTMEVLLGAVAEGWGGASGWLLGQGWSEAEVQRLRARLTEPGSR